MEITRSQRIAGLDLLRALAILMVLAAHYPKAGSGLVTRALNLGWTGVDLFFVLSGYLIGGQLFKAQAEGEQIAFGGFYLRRLLRTLPSYYLVLGVYFWLSPSPSWRYLVFAQNFDDPKTFAPSWSLCVEEQFYLVFPIFVWFLRRSKWLLWSIPAMLGLEFLIRAVTWFQVRPDLLPEPHALDVYMRYLYYPTTCRLDGIILGVGIAAVKWFHPQLWWKLMGQGNRLLLTSGVLFAASILALWKHYSLLCSSAGFTLLNLSFAFLAVAALSPTSLLAGIHIWGAKQLALLSYSVYLTHTLALDLTRHILGGFPALPATVTASILILSFALILHIGVEQPFMALRERLLERSKTRRYLELQNASPLSSH